MADYSMEDYVREINIEGARVARKAADKFSTKEKPRFVAGAIGPTNRTLSLSPDVNRPDYRNISFDELSLAYQEQVEALIFGGVDVLMIETVFDTLNAKAALIAVQSAFDSTKKELPIMVSGTITDASGRTLSGQTTEAFMISLSHMPLLSIGLNCALGAKKLRPYLQILSAKSPFFISAYPNAGLPNAFGEYDETPESMGKFIRNWVENSYINIVGGCCGTTPEHIKYMKKVVENLKPRERISVEKMLRLSGLEPFDYR